MIRVKKLLAGVLAVSVAASGSSATVMADDVFPSDNLILGDDEVPGIMGYYDTESQRFVDPYGNTILPSDHHPELTEEELGASLLPSSYDTRDVFRARGLKFPEVKDQASTGTCWAHAALAALEINGILKGKLASDNSDFSEAYLNYFTMVADSDNSHGVYGDYSGYYKKPAQLKDYFQVYSVGGNQTVAASVMARGSGPIFERSEWDIDVSMKDYLVIDGSDSNCAEIFDVITSDQFLYNEKAYCNYYIKDGEEILLNGSPYYWTNNISTDLYYTPLDESVRYYRDYIMTDSHSYYYDYNVGDISSIDNIKNAIMDNGALTLGYFSGGNKYLSSSNAYYFPKTAYRTLGYDNIDQLDKKDLSTNHEISVIGWDDSYSRNNFCNTGVSHNEKIWDGESQKWIDCTFTDEELRPQNDGAWICRNSWGSDWADGGYFYMSYEEPELREFVSYDIDTTDTYGDKIYQYAGVIGHRLYSNLTNGYTISNMYMADAADTLTAVSFFTFDINSDYTVRIYTDCDDSKPISGTLTATVSGTASEGGYHTVKLNSPIKLNAGQKFSLVMSTNDSKMYIDTNNTSKGQSFLYWSENAGANSAFHDTYSYGNYNFNVLLKALTAGEKSSVKDPTVPQINSLTNDNYGFVISFPSIPGAERYNIYYKKKSSSEPPIYVNYQEQNDSLVFAFINGHEELLNGEEYSGTSKLYFYVESFVTTEKIDELSVQDCRNYVNYFPGLYSGSSFEMTEAQLKAVERVLEADYAA